MQQGSNPMTGTDLRIKTDPVKDLTEIHHNTGVIPNIRVPIQDKDKIPLKKIGSLRTDKVETKGTGPETGIKMVDRDQETGIKVLDKDPEREIKVLDRDQETEIKVVDKEDQPAGHHIPAHPGTILDMMEDNALLPTQEVVNMEDPSPDKPLQIDNSSEETDHHQQEGMIHVIHGPDPGHSMPACPVAHHVIGTTSKPERAPEAAKATHHSAEKAKTGHVPCLKDVGDLVTGVRPQPTPADPPAGTHQGFAHIVVGRTV